MNQNQRWENNTQTLHNNLENLLPTQLRALQRSWRPGSPSSPPQGDTLTLSITLHHPFYLFSNLYNIYSASAGVTCCNQVTGGLADGCSSAGPPHQRSLHHTSITISLQQLQPHPRLSWTMEGYGLFAPYDRVKFFLPHCGMTLVVLSHSSPSK